MSDSLQKLRDRVSALIRHYDHVGAHGVVGHFDEIADRIDALLAEQRNTFKSDICECGEARRLKDAAERLNNALADEHAEVMRLSALLAEREDDADMDGALLAMESEFLCENGERCIDVRCDECPHTTPQPQVPEEVLDLARFMCAAWDEVDKWAYRHCDGDTLVKYPVMQGTRNQLNLRRIGEQPYDLKRVGVTVKWMIAAAQDGER